MTIKQHGGVFGRNPTFNDVTVEGDLVVDGTLTIGGSVITGLNYQGAWNASTNTPDLTVLSPPSGQFWIVSADGNTNLGGITNWTSGDWALYDGSAWQRVEGGTVDLTNGVTGILPIANGGTNASDASTARSNLGSGAVGDNLFTATTAIAAQQAMDTEVGVDVQPYDATILKSADIGVTVEAYDSTILKSADIGVSVQGYDADTAKYDDTTANFTGTLQNGGSNVVVDNDIGVTVEAYDATILKSADIGSTVQGYDADTAKYDDTTANFTGTLQNGGSNVVVDTDIGSTVQAYDADTAKLDVAQTWTAKQTFGATDIDGAVVINESGADVDFRIESDTNANAFFLEGSSGNVGINTISPGTELDVNGDITADGIYLGGTGAANYLDDYEEGAWTPTITTTNSDATVSSYSTRTGSYTKIGNKVIAHCRLTANLSSAGTGDPRVSGLPFSSDGNYYGPNIALWDLFTTKAGYTYQTPFGYVFNASVVTFPNNVWRTGSNKNLSFTIVYEV